LVGEAKVLRNIQLSQYAWIYWIVDHGHECLETVETWEILKYIESASRGFDVLLDSRTKVWDALIRLEKSGVVTKHLSTNTILKEANLPAQSGGARLPGARLAIKEFRSGAKSPSSQWAAPTTAWSTLFNRGRAILLLNQLCRPDDTRLTFDPEDEVSKAIASAKTKKDGRTRLIPMKAALRLMEHAALWVLNIAPALLEFRTKLIEIDGRASTMTEKRANEERQDLLDLLNKHLSWALPLPLVFRNRNGTRGLWVRSAFVRMLPAAAFVSVGALSGRRDTELRHLRRGACSGTEETGYWLQSYIAKTLKSDDHTPCSRLVVAAVQVLEQNASFGAIEGASSDYLFDLPRYGGRRQLSWPVVDDCFGRW